MSALALRLCDGYWPLLYAASPITMGEIAEAWLLREDERRTAGTLEDRQSLERLRLGSELIVYRLPGDFFRFVREHRTKASLFLPLIAASPAGRPH